MRQTCKICNNTEANRSHTAREMAFGLREPFTYLECAQCGCVQLVEIPADMGKYYPANYYSLQPHGKLKTFVRRRWATHAYGQKNLTGWLFSKLFFPHRGMLAVRRAMPQKTAKILDMGCGRGRFLLDLAYLGFTDLTGADPFVEKNLIYENGVRIFKKELAEMPGKFDLVMLHHSFEHMNKPAEAMQQVAEHLNPGGKVILGIPVASSFAWKHYGVNWVNLDAPRHFFLHTHISIEILARKAGLVIDQVIHEGMDEQFWLSEQYAQDISANDPRSLGSGVVKRLFAWKTIRAGKARAKELNRKKEGDLVCFHLRIAE
jgi:SAM-dependent methyltransferase